MEYIKKEELKDGEIYKANLENNSYIVKITHNFVNCININMKIDILYKQGGFSNSEIFKFSLATFEEKHWLNEAIRLDKFITFEEAMKTFIPEYVECIESSTNGFTINKIYKVEEKSIISNKYFYLLDNGNIKRTVIMIGGLWSFKPSTKEAYDAQFVVKEPEFVLPEFWAIRITEESYEKLIDWRIKLPHSSGSSFDKNSNIDCFLLNIDGNWQGYWCKSLEDKKHIEITFEQFKKYVLKEEIVEEKVIEPLPQFKVIETIETITKVENNEGNQFFIGDRVVNKVGIVYTIKEFKYNSNNTNILAVTNIGNIIGIDKIEHYIEPKVEVK